MSRTLFLSDVHLHPGDPVRQEKFVSFLSRQTEVGAIYLLGDLFDYWIGPRHLDLPDYRVTLEGLRRLTGRGVRIGFIPGNRDYLVEQRFHRETGVDLLGEESVCELGGRRVHLSHGDFLFNKNPKYTAYRRLMRFRMLRAAYMALPSGVGSGIALGFRKVSVRTTPYVAWSDEELLSRAGRLFDRGMDVVVCGHIHLPRHLRRDGRELFVMGDWGGEGEYVEYRDGVFSLRRI